MNDTYDKKNPRSIEAYAKRLIGLTFYDVLEECNRRNGLQDKHITGYGDKKRKGGLGNLLEEVYFGYKANSKSEPDFSEANVELKATPYEKTQNGYRAGERLVLSMINYNGPIEENFYESHVWKKCKTLLLIYYLRDRSLQSNLQYPINYVSLFTPSEADLAIIENDYKIIAEKVRSGKAEELSESDTFYLGACTKGATAETSIVPQYYFPHTKAKKRAFCYKNSYMTYVLNERIIPGNAAYSHGESQETLETAEPNEEYESILKDINELKDKSFTEYIVSKINTYSGKTDKSLCNMFNRPYNNNKAQWTELTYRMLGIKSNRAEEFRKANVVVKVIRLEENGSMRESMSFPTFKYKELIEEEWEDSTLHNYFDETRFLFVVFKKHADQYVLKGCQFWNMPYEDLNKTVSEGWTKVVETIRNGIQFSFKQTASGIIVENNLPKKKDNPIVHVRPHARKRYFKFADGAIIGDGSPADANQLPNGTWMPNYCFWINNDYILSQLDTSLK